MLYITLFYTTYTQPPDLPTVSLIIYIYLLHYIILYFVYNISRFNSSLPSINQLQLPSLDRELFITHFYYIMLCIHQYQPASPPFSKSFAIDCTFFYYHILCIHQHQFQPSVPLIVCYLFHIIIIVYLASNTTFKFYHLNRTLFITLFYFRT